MRASKAEETEGDRFFEVMDEVLNDIFNEKAPPQYSNCKNYLEFIGALFLSSSDYSDNGLRKEAKLNLMQSSIKKCVKSGYTLSRAEEIVDVIIDIAKDSALTERNPSGKAQGQLPHNP